MGTFAKIILWLVGGLMLFMVLGIMLDNSQKKSGTGAYSEKSKWENAAKSCWESQARKSLSAYESQNLAKFCEGMDQRARETR